MFGLGFPRLNNAQVAQFVQATRYVTLAEPPFSKKEFPHLPNEERWPSSLMFQIAKPGETFLSWWHWTTVAEGTRRITHTPQEFRVGNLALLRTRNGLNLSYPLTEIGTVLPNAPFPFL